MDTRARFAKYRTILESLEDDVSYDHLEIIKRGKDLLTHEDRMRFRIFLVQLAGKHLAPKDDDRAIRASGQKWKTAFEAKKGGFGEEGGSE